ncbi:MAG: hypothetical protein IJ193_05110 [Bacilli bacterium]|nr:hypothetical protein [Bacilli bacterium]
MSKENFKIFARNHPELISSVMSGNVSWQKLYELYDIYGDNSDIWSRYITNTSEVSFKDVFQKVKSIDMDSFQKGIDNIQKTIGMIQNMGGTPKTPYVPRDVYHRMED